MAKFIGDFTDAMKNYTEEKLKKLESRGINPSEARCKIAFIKEGCSVEISVDNKLRARKKGPSDEYYSIVLDVIDCLISQTDRYNKHLAKKHREEITDSYSEAEVIEEDDNKPYISREKTRCLESMRFEDAVEEMEVLGHDFYVYRDFDLNEDVTILYRRHNGEYAIIRCK